MAPRKYHRPVNYPQLHDREWLYRRYVVADSGLKAIADELGCTTAAVTRALGLAGIDIKGGSGPARLWDPSKDELIAEFVDAGSLDELARRRGLSKATIRNIFARCHIRPMDVDLPRTRSLEQKFPQLGDREWLERELYAKSTRDVADEIGCTPTQVANAARRLGIERRSGRGTPQAVIDRAVRLYEAGNTLKVVAHVVRVDQAQVYRWLRDAGVDTTGRTRRRRA